MWESRVSPDRYFCNFLYLQTEMYNLQVILGKQPLNIPSFIIPLTKVHTAQGSLPFTYLGAARAGEIGKNREKQCPEETALFARVVCLSIPLLALLFPCTLSLFSSPVIFPFTISLHSEAIQTMLHT